MLSLFKKVIVACIAFWAIVITISAQINKDTVVLSTHMVFAAKSEIYHSGAAKENIDSAILVRFSNRTMAELLNENALVNIKSYGAPGSLSTASLRGMAANHVQINWNGIALNSLTSGDVNLGQTPAGIFDEASITPNANGASYGSGSFGGAIDLTTLANKQNDALFSIEHTSLHSISTLYKIHLSKERLSSSTSIWSQNWRNDFDYFDLKMRQEMPRQRAEYVSNGILHNSTYDISPQQTVGLGIWLQEGKSNIPALNGSQPNNFEFQNDQNLRSYLFYKYRLPNALLSINIGYLDNYLNYGKKLEPQDSALAIDSKIRSKQYFSSAEYQYYDNQHFKFIGGLQYTIGWPESNNFAKEVIERSFSTYVSAKYHLKDLTSSLSLRKDFYENYQNPFLLGFGMEYLFPRINFRLHASANQKYRIPTFNERFWQSIGNPDLSPERGISYELGATVLQLKRIVNAEFQVIGYYSHLNDMIRWLSVAGVLGPHVYSDVHARGLETKLKTSFTIYHDLKISNTSQFAFNRTTQTGLNASENIDKNRQLAYTPKYKIIHSTNLFYQSIGIRFSYNYIGQQHYDNTDWWMPSIHTMNASLLYTLTINGIQTSFDLSVDNLKGENQEFIKNYPTPGRVYRIKLNINI